ncbi:MAG: carbohydrate binding family 9 domain-containing protein [Proteobacteria bacterium]|nr:carbohydrate binding family 9 domain-containing protein [Pseudomonadota bacterium]
MQNDPAWRNVQPTSGFLQVQPDLGEPASKKTEVFVGYTDTSLWIALIAYDESPDTIIVSEGRRDSSLDQTDSFRFIIDGFLDQQNGYVFGTNPTGMQYDAQVIKEGGSGQFTRNVGVYDENWDGSWEVVAVVGDFGWSAEFEIPFHTLRYANAATQVWGVNFQRNIRRNNEIVYWAPIGPQHTITRVSEAGTLHGINVPSQRNLQITPYVRGDWHRQGDSSSNDQEAGFDIKYSITPSLTLDATYNTDFAQVEVDDVIVNLDRFSIFLPEKRPFFLENAGQFSVGIQQQIELFFSRRIGIVDGEQVPIEAGLRLSGKVGSATNVGLLYMSDEGLAGVASPNDFLVARVSQELDNGSSVGALFVGRDGEGSATLPAADDQNQTYAIDGRWGIGSDIILEGWVAKTSTPGPDYTGDDYAYAVTANYNSSVWSSRLNFTEVTESFNPEVGFLRRDDFTHREFFLLRRFRGSAESPLLEARPHVRFSDFHDLDGFLESGFRHYDVHWEFKNGYQLETGYNYFKDGLLEPFEIIEGVFVPAGTYSGGEIEIEFNTDLSAPLSLHMENKVGKRFGGDRVTITPTVRYRAGESFIAELGGVYTSFDLPYPGGDFDVTLARLRLSYSFTPKMGIQAVVQYEDESETLSTNLRFSLLRTASSGLYLVYNEFDERLTGLGPPQREFIIKYNYLFDVFQ